ncbi:MAG: tetrahydrofolate dehydrogenase/cyclohydrolase catalytic domain-containing protein [Candidatus Paceibacteria bacterium]
MVFDGKAFAARRREELMRERTRFGALTLGIVAAQGNPVTDSYVRIKEKNADALDIGLRRFLLGADATTDEALRLVREASACGGVIVQLPLPAGIDTDAVLAAIPPERDVDALSGRTSVLPPVVAAIDAILSDQGVVVAGKRAVVVGKGRLVGKPAARYLNERGADVAVLAHGDDLAAAVRGADILVLGAGSPRIVTKNMVKEGVVVFDAGTSEAGGVVVGDADPAVAEKAALFTPVPGGIGPVAVIEIFSNLLKLQKSG